MSPAQFFFFIFSFFFACLFVCLSNILHSSNNARISVMQPFIAHCVNGTHLMFFFLLLFALWLLSFLSQGEGAKTGKTKYPKNHFPFNIERCIFRHSGINEYIRAYGVPRGPWASQKAQKPYKMHFFGAQTMPNRKNSPFVFKLLWYNFIFKTFVICFFFYFYSSLKCQCVDRSSQRIEVRRVHTFGRAQMPFYTIRYCTV